MNKTKAISRIVLVLVVACMGHVLRNNVGADAQQPSAPKSANPAPQAETAGARATDPQRPALHQRYPRYRIRSSDVIDLTFRFTPEFNQEVTVQPDGYIQAR